MNTAKHITVLINQNNAIYTSLINKNIEFNRLFTERTQDDEYDYKILLEENKLLRDIVKQNKPIQECKQKKHVEEKKQEIKDEEEETYENETRTFETITNMEDMKRMFFNNNYEEFEEQVKKYNFKYYKAIYKYSNDKDGSPEYSARNLLNGFIRNFDDYKKYFMICFRCIKHENTTYTYDSLWIVNTNEPIFNIIGSLIDDFDLLSIDDIEQFLFDMRKKEHDTIIGEKYVH